MALEDSPNKLKIDYGGLGISIGSLLLSLIFGLSISYFQDNEFPFVSTVISNNTRKKINCCARLQKLVGILAGLGIVIIVASTLYSNISSDYPFYEYNS